MSKGKTVFILGAGATRGCSFVAKMKNQGRCLPPLDGDFFTQLQRVSNRCHADRINRLISGLTEWFGTNFVLSMEQVFCHFEHAERLSQHLGQEDKQVHQKVVALRKDLEQSIALILGESLTEVKDGGTGSYRTRECTWHDKLVSDLAEPGDAFINFNYDCVLDDSLARKGKGKWDAHYGYGFKLKAKGKGLAGHEAWTPESLEPNRKDASIRVHKVHGSLHFMVSGDEISLKQRPYANPRGGDMRFKIIPPESSKAYDDDGIIGNVMKNAYKDLRSASRVVVIGYSLPPSDQHAEALLRFGVKKDAIGSLVIVNPDRIARRRLRSALQRGMHSTTKVHSFDYLSEFVQADPAIWKV
ncbi:SIR2 family protein [Pelagicoccus sp. NFK12]|uniref:SIR2 family protein n=1 Tax=Pelagicoccus enzymogenes TaxID=2773457 RepID=A0A927F9X5_9BACT|nr:SIR2 family protein [Pelagicoccus enzymogenes]MBD5781057.1 SIR2 family protein [Pelagicoccus enzymogenes]